MVPSLWMLLSLPLSDPGATAHPLPGTIYQSEGLSLLWLPAHPTRSDDTRTLPWRGMSLLLCSAVTHEEAVPAPYTSLHMSKCCRSS